jgi:hypothetical protein
VTVACRYTPGYCSHAMFDQLGGIMLVSGSGIQINMSNLCATAGSARVVHALDASRRDRAAVCSARPARRHPSKLDRMRILEETS